MIQTYIQRVLWFVGLLLLQVLVLNNVHLGGYATPLLYIYFILKLGTGVSRNELMLWAFFLGLSIDVFSDTPGMNAAASVLLAFLRPFILLLYIPRDVQGDFVPSFRTIGVAPFLKYAATGALLHSLVLLTLEYFSFTAWWMLLLRVLLCSLLTTACILAIEGMRR